MGNDIKEGFDMEIDLGKIYSIYDGIIVEILKREKYDVLIKMSNSSFKWVKDSDLEPWVVPGIEKLVGDGQGKRGQGKRGQGKRGQEHVGSL